MAINPMDPIGPREQKVIDLVEAQGWEVNHLPSGKVDLENRKRGLVIVFSSRDEFIEEYEE